MQMTVELYFITRIYKYSYYKSRCIMVYSCLYVYNKMLYEKKVAI